MKKKKLRIIVAYNDPADAVADDLDRISEAAVKDEAGIVFDTLKQMGHFPSMLAVNRIDETIRQVKAFSPDMIFNLCEGFHGQSRHEMHIASLWELLGIPYSGNRPITLGIAQDKALAKDIFRSNGIPTPESELLDKIPDRTKLQFPAIAKPSCEDASLGISQDSIAKNIKELRATVSSLLEKYRQPVLVEEFIDGREFNVAVIGNDNPAALEVSEIDFSGLDSGIPRITGYEAKWLEDHPLYRKTPSVCPAKIGSSLRKKLVSTALKVYGVMMGKDYGRVDFRVDRRENIYVLEFNPNPDISPGAGFSKALKASGMDHGAFISRIIRDNKGI